MTARRRDVYGDDPPRPWGFLGSKSHSRDVRVLARHDAAGEVASVEAVREALGDARARADAGPRGMTGMEGGTRQAHQRDVRTRRRSEPQRSGKGTPGPGRR